MITRRGFIGGIIAASMGPRAFTPVAERPIVSPKIAKIGLATNALFSSTSRLLKWRFLIRMSDGTYIWAPPTTSVERNEIETSIRWRVDYPVHGAQFMVTGMALLSPEGMCVMDKELVGVWVQGGDILKLSYVLDYKGFES